MVAEKIIITYDSCPRVLTYCFTPLILIYVDVTSLITVCMMVYRMVISWVSSAALCAMDDEVQKVSILCKS